MKSTAAHSIQTNLEGFSEVPNWEIIRMERDPVNPDIWTVTIRDRRPPEERAFNDVKEAAHADQ